jgi:uncharacterized protein YcaQ
VTTPGARSLRIARAACQLLHRPPGGTPEGIVRHLLAVQAQDARAARLALRARGGGLTARDVDGALEARELVVGWLARGTLHLVAAEDYPWLLGLTAPTRLATSRRRLAQEGVGADDARRAVAIVERALGDDGPLTRDELAERIGAKGIRTEGQATPHLLMLAALHGVAVLGPRRDGRIAFVLAGDWLGETPPSALVGRAREQALAELARRYLTAHAPASDTDLAAWSGLARRDARAGLTAIASELTELGGGRAELAGAPKAARIEPRLLGPFDPYLLGWKERAHAVPDEHARTVHPGGGVVRAVAAVDGLAVGTWRARARGERLAIEIDPFSGIDSADAAALEAEADDVARFEGMERAPAQRS